MDQRVRLNPRGKWHVVETSGAGAVWTVCGLSQVLRFVEVEDGLPLRSDCCGTCRRLVERRAGR